MRTSQGAAVPAASLTELLRHQPYRIFFPLGAALGGAGVSHWLLYSLGWQQGYSCQAHGLAQVQGFLLAFAAGFLLTMLPRRTRGAPPAAWELALLAAAVSTSSIGALRESWVLAEVAACVSALLLLRFTVARMLPRAGGRAAPDAFVLIPVGLGCDAAGAALLLARETGTLGLWAANVGRGLIQDGVFLCLALGVGSLVLPLLGGHDPAPDSAPSRASRWRRLGLAAAGVLLALSFLAEQAAAQVASPQLGTRLGCGLRLALVLGVLLLSLRAHRRPGRGGSQRTFVWLSAWLVPCGLALATAWPAHRVPFMHATYIGGFGLMAFMVAAHVAFGHGGRHDLRDAPSRAVQAVGLAFVAAMLTRMTADFLSYWTHVAAAAGIWLVALAAWCARVLPAVFARARTD